jgi:hypothetical protein
MAVRQIGSNAASKASAAKVAPMPVPAVEKGASDFSRDLMEIADIEDLLKRVKHSHDMFKARYKTPAVPECIQSQTQSRPIDPAERKQKIDKRVLELKLDLITILCEKEEVYAGWDEESLANLTNSFLGKLDYKAAAMAYFREIIDCWDSKGLRWVKENFPRASLAGVCYALRANGDPDFISKEDVMKNAIDNLARLALVEQATREVDKVPLGQFAIPLSLYGSTRPSYEAPSES